MNPLLVYFIQIEQDGPIKIGVTTAPSRNRIAEIQTMCPWPIRLLGEINGTFAEESWLHRYFAPFRMSGEWFLPDPHVLEDIGHILDGSFSWPEGKKIEGFPVERASNASAVDMIFPFDLATTIRQTAKQAGVRPVDLVIDILRDAMEPLAAPPPAIPARYKILVASAIRREGAASPLRDTTMALAAQPAGMGRN